MNNFYVSTASPVPDTLIRSDEYRNQMTAVEVGFDRVQVKTLAALRAPDGEALGQVPAAAVRAGKSLAFDADGNPIAVIAANTAEMAAAVAAATSAEADAIAAAASAATVAGATNALNLLQLQSGII